jgi:putative FmdB family regulatory protein
MPIYVYRCDCGLRFERLTSFDAAAPGCPSCGGETRKVPAGFSLGGQADAGLSMDRMPQTWRGVYNGNPEYTGQMRRQWESRQRLEAKYPEIAGDQRPILAHEGRYHGAPLRAGDPVLGSGGHGHGHGHGAGSGAAAGSEAGAGSGAVAAPGAGSGAGSGEPAGRPSASQGKRDSPSSGPGTGTPSSKRPAAGSA